ncbi:unnamed protein product [Blepharisma stoltei]|uniref:Carboxypeptidase n=1 Tax=Blepharisma stoltei TaxID=1481888 RepID=A0AAU9JR78_9CILI|nr:unnamed protein product [Blepharisma stoltei]
MVKNMKFLWLTLLSVFISADRPQDLIKTLPWAPVQPTFPMYSGFIPLPNTGGRQIHYVLVKSQGNPAKDPVVLWLNGGPGCSSMEGFLYENGPYYFQTQSTKMFQNPYSWNLNASMLYFEAPAGVGFSPMGSLANNVTSDNQTAIDNLNALVTFFSDYFTELNQLPFYITGESYAGIYIPTLAYFILQYNAGKPAMTINLQGIMVGNGITDWKYDQITTLPDLLWWHTMYGYPLRNTWVNNNCSIVDEYPYTNDPICMDAFDQMMNLMNNINPYDIYRTCIYDPIGNMHLYTPWMHAGLGALSSPCVDSLGLTHYFNNAQVRAAFNIPSSFSLVWNSCANLDYQYDYARGSIYVYPYLLNSGIKIRIYSGDTDSVVPVTGTIRWITNLNLKITKDWTPWYLNSQVGGFYVTYTNNLTFMTIKGTGHMSIQWKRPEGYHMFTSFLSNQNP